MTDTLDAALAAQLGRPLYDAINKHLADGQQAEATVARVEQMVRQLHTDAASARAMGYETSALAIEGSACRITDALAEPATGPVPVAGRHLSKEQ